MRLLAPSGLNYFYILLSVLLSLLLSLFLSSFKTLYAAETHATPPTNYAHVDYISDFQYEQQLQINAKITLHLSPEIKQAIQHEVPIRFKTDIILSKKITFLGIHYYSEKENASYETELRYFKYTRTYILTNFRNQQTRSFNSLQDALYTLGTLESFPVTNLDQLHPSNEYELKVRLQLDPWKLPVPLIITALTSSHWAFKAPWLKHPIQAPTSWN